MLCFIDTVMKFRFPLLEGTDGQLSNTVENILKY